MNLAQAVHNSFSVKVFGAATLHVEPDIASFTFSVVRLAQNPKEAFRELQKSVQKVQSFLSSAKLAEVSMSRPTLTESFANTNSGLSSKSYGSGSKVTGYQATVKFHVLLRDLTRVEDTLIGIMDANANNLASVELQTTQLKEHRAEAQRRAIKAAHEKAENYCATAGIKLGDVLYIEEVIPNALNERLGYVVREPNPDDEGAIRTINPSSIVVNAIVMVAYQFTRVPSAM